MTPPTPDCIEAIFFGLVALACFGAATYLLLRAWWGA